MATSMTKMLIPQSGRWCWDYTCPSLWVRYCLHWLLPMSSSFARGIKKTLFAGLGDTLISTKTTSYCVYVMLRRPKSIFLNRCLSLASRKRFSWFVAFRMHYRVFISVFVPGDLSLQGLTKNLKYRVPVAELKPYWLFCKIAFWFNSTRLGW